MGLLQGPGLVIVSLLAAFLSYRFLLRTPALRRHGIPLPTPPNTLPLVGNGLLFLQARQKLFAWFVKCERQFGYETFQISVPSLPPGVVVHDPRNLEYVFKHEGVFAKGAFVKQRSWDLFGHGIINVDGDLWRAQRKAGLAFLNAANLRVLTDVALPQYLAQAVARLADKSAEGAVVDLQALFHDVTSQLMGKMAYNMEMHADDEFTTAFDYASGVTAERFQNPLWFVTEVFTGARFRKSLAIVKSFGERIVQSAVDDIAKASGGSGGSSSSSGGGGGNGLPESRIDEVSGSLIKSFLNTIDDEKIVAEAALNYLSAGRDTVAQALTWAMMLLMHNRPATDRVRREVDGLMQRLEVQGDGQQSGSVAFTPAALPYTMAVFYEALRLYPPVPIEIKQCEKATTLPDGTYLPAKSVVLWCPWAMNRSKVTWGDDADTFRPERWLADGRLATKSAAEFPVFNGGPRTCLGKRMAELLAVQVLATMLLRFRFMPAYGSPRASKSSLTLPMDGGLPCYVKARDEVAVREETA